MHPDGQHGRNVQERVIRPDHPVQHQHRIVRVADAEKFRRDPGPDHVPYHQRYDCETKAQLRPFPAREPQRTPHVDRPQRVEKVQQKGGREQKPPDLGPPERHEDAKNAAGQRDRNQKKDVAREVADDECQQDERTDQPQARTNDVPQAFELPPPAQAGLNRRTWADEGRHRCLQFESKYPCGLSPINAQGPLPQN
jgi:hypothetical protein